MTAVWGAGLIAQMVLQIILAFALSIEQDLVVSPIVGYGFYFVLFGWSFWYGKKRKKQREGLEAEAAK
jgi:phosphate/sulfate permease